MKNQDRINDALERFSHRVTVWAGSSRAFGLALLALIAWAATGPLLGFSESWQLVVNTGTTIVTFLMVFLIQRSQNKESQAVQLKLNELLAAQQGASNRLINVEDLNEQHIKELHERFGSLTRKLETAKSNGEAHSVEEVHETLAEANRMLDKARDAKRQAMRNVEPAGEKRAE
jgi:low affinity Fe/Cu permease